MTTQPISSFASKIGETVKLIGREWVVDAVVPQLELAQKNGQSHFATLRGKRGGTIAILVMANGRVHRMPV